MTMLDTKHFRVHWYVDVWATDACDAAEQAQGLQRDPRSTATCYEVVDDKNRRVDVDLTTKAPT